MTLRPNPTLARYAVIAAVVAVVCAPLLALAWFGTEHGAEMAGTGAAAAWAEPARDLVGPLVTFAAPDTVYAVYTWLLMLAFPAIPLVALATRSRRIPDATRPERVGWWVALGGYTLFWVGGALMAVLLVTAGPDAVVIDALFLAGMMPGMLLSLIGSTMLGVSFLRAGHRPRVTAWLLTLAIPLWIIGSAVLGHNSLGMVPLFIAWAVQTSIWTIDDSAARGAFSLQMTGRK